MIKGKWNDDGIDVDKINDGYEDADADKDDNEEDDDDNLKTQQTPKEEAQVPLAVPPFAVHSLELGFSWLKLPFNDPMMMMRGVILVKGHL